MRERYFPGCSTISVATTINQLAKNIGLHAFEARLIPATVIKLRGTITDPMEIEVSSLLIDISGDTHGSVIKVEATIEDEGWIATAKCSFKEYVESVSKSTSNP